jgi:hypothetical protein
MCNSLFVHRHRSYASSYDSRTRTLFGTSVFPVYCHGRVGRALLCLCALHVPWWLQIWLDLVEVSPDATFFVVLGLIEASLQGTEN